MALFDKEKIQRIKEEINKQKEETEVIKTETADKKYIVLQVVLKEKLIGTGSRNLSTLENVINQQANKGYRLHTLSTENGGSKGVGGGDRIQATLVFEKI